MATKTKSKSGGSKSSSRSKSSKTGTSAESAGREATDQASQAMTPGAPQIDPPTKAVDEGKKKPKILDDLHTPADHQATPGHFVRITKGDYAGEFGVLIENTSSEDVIVRLHRAPGLRLAVPYGDLVQDSPYGSPVAVGSDKS